MALLEQQHQAGARRDRRFSAATRSLRSIRDAFRPLSSVSIVRSYVSRRPGDRAQRRRLEKRFVGVDAFTDVVSDGHGDTATGGVTVTVTDNSGA